IVTNAHVASGASGIVVTLADGKTKKDATVLGIDTQHDLAVLKISGTGYPVVELCDSNGLEAGDSVVAIGNALALEGKPTMASGSVSAPNGTIEIEESTTLTNVIHTHGAINHGNSGSALIDSSGKLIRINTAIASPDEANNIGFAIAISSAEPELQRL